MSNAFANTSSCAFTNTKLLRWGKPVDEVAHEQSKEKRTASNWDLVTFVEEERISGIPSRACRSSFTQVLPLFCISPGCQFYETKWRDDFYHLRSCVKKKIWCTGNSKNCYGRNQIGASLLEMKEALVPVRLFLSSAFQTLIWEGGRRFNGNLNCC